MDKYFLLLVVIGMLFVIYLYKDTIFVPDQRCHQNKKHIKHNKAKKSNKKPKKSKKRNETEESSLKLTDTDTDTKTDTSENESVKSSMSGESKSEDKVSEDKISIDSKTFMSDQSGLSNMSNLTDASE